MSRSASHSAKRAAQGISQIGARANFGTRAPILRDGETSAHTAANVWLKINEVIDYQISWLEKNKKGSTCRVPIEMLNENNIELFQEIFEWIVENGEPLGTTDWARDFKEGKKISG